MHRNHVLRGLIVCSVVWFSSCASEEKVEKPDYNHQLAPGQSALERVTDPAQYPDFRSMYGDRDAILRGLEQSLAWFAKPSSQKFYPFEGFTHERMVKSLQELKSIVTSAQSPAEFSGLIASRFEIYRSIGWNGKGVVLFTAYYQPIFDGSMTADATYRFPLYRKPEDLVKAEDGTPLGRQAGEQVVSYYTREEIERDRIFEGKKLELVYLKSKLDAYIIQVQGSAKIRLPDGKFLHVGYAGKTDRPYTGLGTTMVEEGKIPAEELSLARIRQYFDAHPDQLDSYLNRNESYVFFAESDAGGPYGSLGAAVTPYRTLATDKSIFPRGAACAVETQMPRSAGRAAADIGDFKAITFDQDTGGAIRSPGRCDVFVGTGPDAEQIAGHTHHEGRLFYLIIKP